MARAYSLDLRLRALDLIAGGMSISKVSRLLNISRPTLYKWTLKLKNTGSTVPKTTVPPPAPSKITDWQKFQEFVEHHGDKTQQEMAQLWGNVSRHTISRGLKKLGYTRKKKPMVIKIVAKKRAANLEKN